MGSRHHVNKRSSARHFRSQAGRTKSPNVLGPMRGGYRF